MHLTPNGHLTQSQQDEANKLGISTNEMTDIVLQRIADYNKERCSKNKEKLTVKCKNPIIVIGHGPNWKEEAIKIKGTKIPIIATDVCSNKLIDMGIIPTYICTYEEARKRINNKLFNYKAIDKHSIQVIGSTITRDWLDHDLDKIGMDLYRFEEWSAYEISNVGIFSAMFADRILKCDKIILIGMNCWDGDKGNPYLNWYVHWRQYFDKMPDKYFINCTQGGVLYNGKILECDFDNLEVKWAT